MATPPAPEKGSLTLVSAEKSRLVVLQPTKLRELTNLLETFENLNARVGERVGEDSSGDLGGAGGTTGQQGDDQVSPRDRAIRAMPGSPQVLRDRLSTHIQQEVQSLDREAKRVARGLGRPGAACRLTELYAKMHRLSALLADLIEASLEVLQRLFIRVFIDRQALA